MQGARRGQGARRWGILGIAALALAACASDPAEYGITGPFPGGAPPVTLKRPDQKPERVDDALGGQEATETQTAPPGLTSANGPTDRYYGYKR